MHALETQGSVQLLRGCRWRLLSTGGEVEGEDIKGQRRTWPWDHPKVSGSKLSGQVTTLSVVLWGRSSCWVLSVHLDRCNRWQGMNQRSQGSVIQTCGYEAVSGFKLHDLLILHPNHNEPCLNNESAGLLPASYPLQPNHSITSFFTLSRQVDFSKILCHI